MYNTYEHAYIDKKNCLVWVCILYIYIYVCAIVVAHWHDSTPKRNWKAFAAAVPYSHCYWLAWFNAIGRLVDLICTIFSSINTIVHIIRHIHIYTVYIVQFILIKQIILIIVNKFWRNNLIILYIYIYYIICNILYIFIVCCDLFVRSSKKNEVPYLVEVHANNREGV